MTIQIAGTISAAVRLMPALASLLLGLWCCTGTVSIARAEADDKRPTCSDCAEMASFDAEPLPGVCESRFKRW